MIDKNKLNDLMNKLNAKVAYCENGTHFRWTGELPEGIDLVAPFPNMFASEKNKAKWIAKVSNDMPNNDGKSDEVLGKVESPFDKMTKKELDEYAMKEYGVELDRRSTKEKMIAELQEKIN